MKISNHFERALLILDTFDQNREMYIYQGYVMNERYIIYVDEGTLWLRHVQRVTHIDHLYIDGDTGGLVLAEHIHRKCKRDARVNRGQIEWYGCDDISHGCLIVDSRPCGYEFDA